MLAMVVSHNFLDAKNDTTRRWIAERANLVSAVHVPRTAFKENSRHRRGDGHPDLPEEDREQARQAIWVMPPG